jgi:hypothetical protein
MTPNEEVIFTAFIQSLTRLDQKLPDDLQSQLNQLPDVENNALKLESLIKTNADLAKLYQEECDRLMAEASDRKKGYLPKFEADPYNTELGNLVQQICHASDSAGNAKGLLKSGATGGIIGSLKQLFSR